MSAQFTALMRDLGAMAGLGDLKPGEAMECVLGVDNFIVTLACQDEEQLLLYAGVGSLPARGREKFLLRLLRGNYFFAETGGATLAADPATGDIQLLYRRPLAGLDGAGLARLLEGYLERLEYWSGICSSNSEAIEPAAFALPFGGIRG